VGVLYHVTARGNERRALFRDDVDRSEYLSRLANCRHKLGFQVLCYCLMTNHVHLAIRTGFESLSRIMARLHSGYAEWFNRRHNRVGHLFQGRYKAFLVRDDRHLYALIRYIHLNPVQARVTQRARDYSWSSDRFLRAGSGPDWLSIDSLLTLLSESRRSAIRAYVELVDGSPAEPANQSSIPDRICALAPVPAAAGTELDPVVRAISIERLLEIVAKDSGLTPGQLRGSRRGGEFAEARCRAAYLARQLFSIPLRRIALYLNRDDSVFASPVVRLESRAGNSLPGRGKPCTFPGRDARRAGAGR
jgi:REP element-mobilizing transposase RayT